MAFYSFVVIIIIVVFVVIVKVDGIEAAQCWL